MSTIDELRPESEVSGCNFVEGVIQDTLLDRLDLRQCSFNAIKLLNCNCAKIYVKLVRFVGCDLSNTKFTQGKFVKVEFKDCKLMGTSFAECDLEQVRFTNCLMELSQFSQIKARRLIFENCQLGQSYFDSGKLPHTIFKSCNLSQADFSGASILGSDIRGCSLDGVKIGTNQLAKVIVNPDQALYLARLMGLEIEF